MCVHVFLKIIEMNKSRRVYNSQLSFFPVYIDPQLKGFEVLLILYFFSTQWKIYFWLLDRKLG